MAKKTNKFETTFKELHIPVSPLPNDYNPDEYGWSLTHKSENKERVSYSNETKIVHKL